MHPFLQVTLTACFALGLPILYLHYLKKNRSKLNPEILQLNTWLFGIFLLNALIGIWGEGAIDYALVVLQIVPGNPTFATGGLIGQSLILFTFGIIFSALLKMIPKRWSPLEILTLLLGIPSLWVIKKLIQHFHQ